ncbi:enoyl-CoA hydratase/isomerase family protein [Novosphingobium fluoreni]|uniref:enoyl-CoA hydratase/isomerase family protein n=1 Tax=Novosphingobium fluoreni TaxID=1391222 RepID=UPI003DA052B5
MDEADALLVDRPHPEILRLTLNRPERMNALTYEVVNKLNDILDSLVEDTQTRAVIITGNGRGFCSGQDMKKAAERMEPGGSTIVTRYASQTRFGSMSQRMARAPQPIICAINGAAVGAGMAIAVGADIRIGTPATRFLIGAVKIGLSAGESSISYWLPRWIGPGRAFEVMLTGRPIDAEEALATGLITRCVEPEELQDAAIAQAVAILENAPFSTWHTKRIMRRNLDATSLDAALDVENPTQIVTNATEDYREAVAAFNEKRKPVWRGR